MWRGPPLFIQVVKVSCYSRQFILIIRYTEQRTTFYSNGRPISHSHITPLPLSGSPGPSRSRARNIFQSRKYFLNPIHQLRLCSETRRARQMIDATETGARSDVGKYFLLKTKIISLSSSYHRRKLATDAYPLRGR